MYSLLNAMIQVEGNLMFAWALSWSSMENPDSTGPGAQPPDSVALLT